MKKTKTFIVLGTTALLAVSMAMIVANPFTRMLLRADPPYSITLDQNSEVVAKDMNTYHQISIKNNKFDMLGWEAVSGKLGSIKKATYGSYQWNGMIYNRSIINGFGSLTVNFSGGTLYCLFTDFLMEDMTFANGVALTSGSSVSANNKPYFLIYNTNETPVVIDSIELGYTCDESSTTGSAIYNINRRTAVNTLGGARSLAKTTTLEDGFVTLENNPTVYTNNCSVGKHGDHKYNDTWYRWNGRYLPETNKLGTEFSFGMTIIGNISQILDMHAQTEDNYFHYAVWPQFGYYDTNDELQTSDNNYVQTYIGNDNWDPTGVDADSYTGRFFSDYGWYDDGDGNEDWRFPNPDVATIADGHTTFRQAYNAYSLPFWFVRFDVSLNASNDPVCKVSINGFEIFTQEIFYDDPDDNPYNYLCYDRVNTPDLVIHTLPMHCVNYGVDASTPASSYEGSFTYPRLIASI